MSQILIRTDTRGTKHWELDGLYHRHDGPAIIYQNGLKEWYYKGHRHRMDGPSVEGLLSDNGEHVYYVDGAPVKKEFIEWCYNNNIRWPFDKSTKVWIELVWGENEEETS